MATINKLPQHFFPLLIFLKFQLPLQNQKILQNTGIEISGLSEHFTPIMYMIQCTFGYLVHQNYTCFVVLADVVHLIIPNVTKTVGIYIYIIL